MRPVIVHQRQVSERLVDEIVGDVVSEIAGPAAARLPTWRRS